MANNHVELGDGTQIMDIRDTTATPETVPEGDVFYGADGERKMGTFTLGAELSEQSELIAANQTAADNNAALIAQIKTALEGKAAGSTPETVEQATPTITVSNSGLITASATQTEGFVEGGTKSATMQLPTAGGATITPGAAEQVAASAGTYITGDIVVGAVESGGAVVTCTVTVDDSVGYGLENIFATVLGEDGVEAKLVSTSGGEVTVLENVVVNSTVFLQASAILFFSQTGAITQAYSYSGSRNSACLYVVSGDGIIETYAEEA